jgi:serine protease
MRLSVLPLLLSLLVVAGCPEAPIDLPPAEETPAPDLLPTPVQPISPPVIQSRATVTGQLSVQVSSGTRSVFEQEPNNTLLEVQDAGSIALGGRISVFGNVSVMSGDDFDAFEVKVSGPLRIELTLSYEEPDGQVPPDLDLAYYDFETSTCAPDGLGTPEFTGCYDTTNNPETALFEVDGPFVVAVTASSGSGGYQLDVRARAVGSSTQSPPPQVASSDKPLKRLKSRRILPLPSFQALPGHFVAGELLVEFDKDMKPEECAQILADAGMSVMEQAPCGTWRVSCSGCQAANLHLAGVGAVPASWAGATAAEAVLCQAQRETLRDRAVLRGRTGVHKVQSNGRRYIARTPNDPHFPLQWHYSTINLPEAWDLTTGSDDVVVAVVDTGILSAHPDFAGRLVPGYDFISDPASARDGDGRDANPEDAGDLFGGPGQSSFHGTHVAGTIGATTDNGVGVAGVTWQTKIMPLRALGVNGGTSFDVAQAVRYAAGLPNVTGTVPDRPARIINLSIASSAGAPPSEVETAAITEATAAGVLVVSAAGNEGSALPSYPAATPAAISVGAVDLQLNRASYSNFGATLDLAAPGGFNGADLNGDEYADGVLSTGADDSSAQTKFQYVFSNGTSMASPHVAGVAALVLSVNPSLTASQVREVLETTALDLGAVGRDDVYGWGLVDAAAAVREALLRSGAPQSTEPVLSLSTSSLDFNASRTELQVRMSNSGGGFLTINNLTTQETEGTGWLSAHTTGTAAHANAAAIVVRVDRTGLPEGLYHGRVTVQPEGLPAATIDVIMTVGQEMVLDETVYVLAVEPGVLTSIAQDETGQGRDFAYSISDLRSGEYVIYAGTDRNDDGYICDLGDLCGALPSVIEPQVLKLSPGQQIQHADFGVAELVLQQLTPPAGKSLHIKRIR